jgi:hypothetical protein
VDPDSEYGSGSTNLIESGSNPEPDTDPDPKPWISGAILFQGSSAVTDFYTLL